jgi:phosphoglycerate dehydrogenase-like enzyme
VPTPSFVNLSRGNLVDESALTRALDEGWIAGAAMDVGRAPDRAPSPALAIRPNVIATPHIGGLTPEALLPASRFGYAIVALCHVKAGMSHDPAPMHEARYRTIRHNPRTCIL